jgi:predicted nucleic-acid-binding protein
MVIVDTNVLARFLLKDHPLLSPQARDIIANNEIYVDEVVISELVWLLQKVYQKTHEQIYSWITKLIQTKDIHNKRSNLLAKSLLTYSQDHNLSFVDCWLHVLAKDKTELLATFDQKLSRYHKQN